MQSGLDCCLTSSSSCHSHSSRVKHGILLHELHQTSGQIPTVKIKRLFSGGRLFWYALHHIACTSLALYLLNSQLVAATNLRLSANCPAQRLGPCATNLRLTFDSGYRLGGLAASLACD